MNNLDVQIAEINKVLITFKTNFADMRARLCFRRYVRVDFTRSLSWRALSFNNSLQDINMTRLLFLLT